jgi:Lsr2
MAQAIILLDDLDLAAMPPARSEATRTVRFTVDGREWELDLTEAHGKEFDADLSRWVSAAHKPAGPPPHAVRTYPGRRPSAYYAGMQEFAVKAGISIPRNSEGKNEYPRRLRRQWEEHLAAHPGLVTWGEASVTTGKDDRDGVG